MTEPTSLDIVIAGGGTAGWTAAAILARFLGNRATITLVESDAIGTVGVGEATIPQIHNLIIGLGLDQAEFLRRTNATFKLGIEFSDWLRPGHRYIHSFGQVGRGVGLIPFRQLWLRGRHLDVAGDYGDYSYNVAATRLGRFATTEGRDGKPTELAYAYHFDAALFAAMLRDYAEERGVRRVEGLIEQVERDAETGDIRALRLDRDREIAGSFFIDCTGFRSLLLGDALGVPFVDWRRFLPCDTALAVPSETRPELRPYTQSMARPAGWQWRIPLQHRTGNGHVFCSDFMSVDEASELLLANVEGKALADPRPIRFTSGHRKDFWSHNCVALGLAAGFMEPLESTSIHLVQSGLGRLLTLLSGDLSNVAIARDTFNRLSTIEWQRIRDFIVLHYAGSHRDDTPFWRDIRAMSLPDSLQYKIETFRETGVVPLLNEESFVTPSWQAVLCGLGIVPKRRDALLSAEPQGEIETVELPKQPKLKKKEQLESSLLEAIEEHGE